MTVPTNTNKVVYAGDGVNTTWSFSFLVLQASDLSVYVTDAFGTITTLNASQYSVDLTNSRITYPLTGSPLASGMKITILRTVNLLQEVDWKKQGPFDAEVLEQSEDKIAMALQQLNESISRAVKYGVDQVPSDTTTSTVLAALNAAVAALANVQAMTYLTPTANTINDNKVAVAAGKLMKADGTGAITYAGGQSPAFSVVTANSRIDLLCIDDTGALTITQGVQAASPVPPLYPAGKTVIAEVTITETATVLITAADIKDVRPFLDATFSQAYVDSTLWKAPVRAATTAALAANTYSNGTNGYGATLTANANGALAAVDGITLAVGDRLLVKNEATGANNGIYTLTQLGDGTHPYILTRAPDAAVPAALAAGTRLYVQQGTVNAGVLFTQTATGTITIGTTALTFSGNQALGGNKMTGSGAAAANGELVRYEQVSALWSYRRPVLQWSSGTQVNLETGNQGTAGSATILFPDGTFRSDSTASHINFVTTRNAALTGAAQSGLRAGLTAAANTWYALYAVKVQDNANDFVVVGDTLMPLQVNFATLNANFGTNGWVYLGVLPYGDNAGSTTAIPKFAMAGNKTVLHNSHSGNSGAGLRGVTLVTGAGVTTITWTYAAGTAVGTSIPAQLAIGDVNGGLSTGTLYSLFDSASVTTLAKLNLANGLQALLTPNVLLSQGFAQSASGTVNQDLELCGWFDGALGVGSNPLL